MYRRRVALIIICCIWLAFLCFVHTADVYADSAFQDGNVEESKGHLIVSMVYDDSGSMEGDKGTYCNYTFQMFLSLFGEEDELFITYMSKPLTSSNYSIHDNRQERINNLRAHTNKIFTPIASIKTAYDRLLYEEGDSNDSYWLIILTDGFFYGADDKIVTQEELDNYIRTYTNTVLRNGHKINVLYVGIGDEVMYPSIEAENLDIVRAKEPHEIPKILDACAGAFSDTIKGEDAEFVQMVADERELHLKTTIPLERVIVIEHNIEEDNEYTLEATEMSGERISVEEEMDIFHSYVNYELGLQNKLNGRVTYFAKEGGYIQDGLDIVFDHTIETDEVMIYVKPAVELVIEYKDATGTPIKIKDCSLKDILEGNLVFHRLDTGEIIKTTELSRDNVNHISVTDSRRRMLLAEGDEAVLFDISMVKEGMIVDGVASFSKSSDYAAEDLISLYVSTIEDKEDYRFERTGLVNNREEYLYFVTKNDSVVSRKKMTDFKMEFETDIKCSLFHIKSYLKNDGTLHIVPSFGYDNVFGKVFVNWLCVWLLPEDSVEITVNAYDIMSDLHLCDTFAVNMTKGPFLLELWYYIYPFVVLLMITGYFLKKRFKKRSSLYFMRLIRKGDRLVPYDGRWKRYSLRSVKIFGHGVHWNWGNLIPYVPNWRKCNHFVIIATQPIWRDERSIAISLRGWKYFRLNITKRPSVSDIEYSVSEHRKEVENQGKYQKIVLEPGEYVVFGNSKEYFLVHLGRG